ncbi:GNAT family N-acetyltransferase [Alkalithermobacter paradoxus]|uniref:Putative acetyltransferase n=1 Tax=Alkalithermobacter paradoxus TaxID=29349 RepID=A0A1V4I7T4_9FIRM|nr:putative acetyltransferase [[Clostridium] thermoalcaliphilum]
MLIRKLEQNEYDLIRNIEYYYESDKEYILKRSGMTFDLDLKDIGHVIKRELSINIEDNYLKEVHINVIEQQGEIIGFIQMGYEEMNKMAVIMNIWVREDKRRDNIGKKLIKSSKGYARYVNSKGVYVEVDSKNYPAINFLIKNGFDITGINEDIINKEVIIGLTSVF